MMVLFISIKMEVIYFYLILRLKRHPFQVSTFCRALWTRLFTSLLKKFSSYYPMKHNLKICTYTYVICIHVCMHVCVCVYAIDYEKLKYNFPKYKILYIITFFLVELNHFEIC
jgi:hypothetical protein